MIGPSEKSGIEIQSEYQLTGHPVIACVQYFVHTEDMMLSTLKSQFCQHKRQSCQRTNNMILSTQKTSKKSTLSVDKNLLLPIITAS